MEKISVEGAIDETSMTYPTITISRSSRPRRISSVAFRPSRTVWAAPRDLDAQRQRQQGIVSRR
jgi:hypothetical protein